MCSPPMAGVSSAQPIARKGAETASWVYSLTGRNAGWHSGSVSRMVYRTRCSRLTRHSATCLATPQPTSIRHQTSCAPMMSRPPGPRLSCRRFGTAEATPDDRVGAATKFAPPLVANGKVYMATFDNQIVVYGLESTVVNAQPDKATRSSSSTPRPRRDRICSCAAEPTGQIVCASVIATGSTTIPTIAVGNAYLDWQGAEKERPRHRPTLGRLRPPIGARASLKVWDSPSCQQQSAAMTQQK